MDRQILIDKAARLDTRAHFLDLVNEIKSELLGDKYHPFTARQLSILSSPKNGRWRYRTSGIPKKSGGIRLINAPRGSLKWFQTCINVILRALYTPSPYAMGFTAGKSIVDNARMHIGHNYVFNIDLEDFFTSIDQARVWKRLQLAPFNFNKSIASTIAGLCSIQTISYSAEEPFGEDYVLPQGAPTSPLLTNAICDTLDRRLHGLAKRFGLHYSRYADDITFSSMHNVYQPGSEFRKELERIISGQNFRINQSKTRLNHCSRHQEVTGLTVGEKINVPHKYVKDIRAILHIWEKYGYGAAYATFYPRYKSEKCQLNRRNPNLVNVISGKLCYLRMVKGDNDPIYTNLHAQFARLVEGTAEPQQKHSIEYLSTLPKRKFEEKLGVEIEFRKRGADKEPYGCFLFQGKHFVVAVSKNIDVERLPKYACISLTRMTMPDDTYPVDDPQDIVLTTRIGYLLHKPLCVRHRHNASPTANIPEEHTQE